MAVSILDVCIGKYYCFSAPEAVMFSNVSGLVIDKTQNELTLKTDAGELQTMTIQPWIVAEEAQKSNSQVIESQLDIIRQRFQEIAQYETDLCTNENEAVDGIEEKREFEATGYYLHNGFPHKVFNTIPYVLNRDEDNPVAFQLLLYALDYCISFPELYPHAYMPYFPNQLELFSEENIAVLRRVARVIRSALVRANYQEGADLRFTGVITTFTGDHGWINVNDKLSLRFSKDSILDNRLIEILKLGMPVVGWTEVTFSICRTQSGYYACRVRPTELAISVAKQLGCDISGESSLPDNFEDSPICGRNSLPQSLQDTLLYIENKDMFTPRKTLCGNVIACIEDTDDRSKYVGQILANGNIYNFHYYQVCDESVAAAWREKQLVGKMVVFEPAFNFTKNIVSLSADYVRYNSFTTEIPKADCEDLAWGVCVYDRNELESFVQLDNVNREFVPLQPWLPIYDEFLGNGTVGRINPHSTRQRGWIHLTNGFRYGFFYSQIQDRLLYVLLNSALRESIDWSKVDICFTPKKANGVSVADNVILTMKSRLELSKRFGLEGPVMPLSEKMVFTRRTSFVPIDANTAKLPDIESSEEIIAEITDYNQVQKRIKLTQKPSTTMEVYNLRFEWIKDSVLIEALNNNRWRDISVSYQKRISMDGKYYPYDLKLTTLCREKLEAQLNSKEVEPIKKAEPISEQRTVQIPQPQIKRELGILLPTKREATGGYIGKEYYTKACGMQQFPGGVASYDKRLLSFEPEFQYVYVVSYTYNAQQAGNVKYALSVDYYAKYEYSSLGKIIVRADGIVEVTSLLAVTADKYLRRDVSIILKTGDSVDGVVESFDKNSFSIMTSDGDNARIDFETIERVYIFGEIRPYFAVNGTGRIDQYFFFHINNMALSAEAAQITDGVQVKFTLRGVKRDNGLEAADIQIAPDDYLDVFVVGKSDTGEYSVVNVSDYGAKYGAEEQSVQIKNAPGMLNHEYCDYKVRLRKKRTETKWNWTTDGITRPKLWYGYLTSLENQIAVVKNELQHKTNQAGVEFKCTELVRYIENNGVNGVVDTNRYDYTIMYTLAKQLDGSMRIHVTKVCGREQKRRFGILHTFISNGSYGFIVADEDADVSHEVRRQQNLDYYCTFESMKNPPATILTRYNQYYVAFVGETMFSGRRKATQVEFIRISPLETRRRQNTASGEDTINNQATEEYEIETSVIDLDDTYPIEEFHNRMRYGILRAYSPRFEEIRIFDNYILGGSADTMPVAQPIAIAGSDATFTEGNIKTNQYVYLIRYITEQNTDENEDTLIVDNDIPIEVLQAYPRKETKLLEVNGNVLRLERRVRRSSPVEEVGVASFYKGESLYVESKTGTDAYIAEYLETCTDGKISTTKGLINLQNQKISRFGVITDFDEVFSWGVINSCCRVDLSIMEGKAYNMLKTMKRQMLILYTCNNDQITSITRCDSSVMAAIPWKEGFVQHYGENAEDRIRYIEVRVGKDNAKHYLSTMSDGYVCKKMKKDALHNEHVFVRLISLPMKENGTMQIIKAAPDIHCIAEEDTLIEYDPLTNKCLAVRNPTVKVPLDGNEEILRSYDGQQVEVIFYIQDYNLAAYIGAAGMTEDDVELITDALPQTAFDTSLSQFLNRRLDLNPFMGMDTLSAAADIRGRIPNRSERNWLIAFMAKKEYGIETPFTLDDRSSTCLDYMIKGIHYRLGEVFGAGESQNPDEYFYYANTLIQMSQDETKYAFNLYRAFQVDFCALADIRTFERNRGNRSRNFEARLNELFARDPIGNNLVSHILQLDELKREYLSRIGVFSFPQISQAIINWCKSYNVPYEANDIRVLLTSIKQNYLQTKTRAINDLSRRSWVDYIQESNLKQMVKYACATDNNRLQKFMEECVNVSRAMKEGYKSGVRLLKEAFRCLSELKRSIESQPTLEAVDLLYNTGVLNGLIDMVCSKLDILHRDIKNAPRIRCELLNKKGIERNDSILIVVSNEDEAQQEAQEISIDFVWYDERVELAHTAQLKDSPLKYRNLRPGEQAVYEAPIMVDSNLAAEEEIEITCIISYKRIGGFINGTEEAIKGEPIEQKFRVQLKRNEERIDKSHAVNMYAKHHNEILKDKTMFFGRNDEKEQILNFIIDENDRFVSGRVVIVYGQKKCGKSSLLYQIMNDVQTRSGSKQKAIVLRMDTFMANVNGHVLPTEFYPQLYAKIISEMRGVIRKDHKELNARLKEDEMQIPNALQFKETMFHGYVEQFIDMYGDEYQIVLLMDEFTSWCTRIDSISATHPEACDSLQFVKMLSDMGFVQIIIGHDNMMRAISNLGKYNEVAQFASKINITAFIDDDAKMMIQDPMIQAFGINPYDTPVGSAAIKYILDVSGKSPFVLMKLCDRIFDYYVKTPDEALMDSEIKAIVRDDILNNGIWPLHEFNFMLEEAGDDQQADEQRLSFKYLKTVALNYDEQREDCDADIYCEELSAEENRSVRDKLIARNVISMKNGRVKICVGLFREYIIYTYGRNR